MEVSDMTVASISLSRPSAATAIQLLLGSLLLGLAAQLEVWLPFTPVPMTMQTLTIMLLGASLGSRKAAATVALYLGEAAMGMPLLAGAAGGLLPFVGPTAGYLVGFVPLAYLSGLFFEKMPTAGRGVTVLFLGVISCLQLLLGSLWLSNFVAAESLLAVGFMPFIAGDLLKCVAVACITRR
jgi:biotin transport system substrate-specific component